MYFYHTFMIKNSPLFSTTLPESPKYPISFNFTFPYCFIFKFIESNVCFQLGHECEAIHWATY